MQVYLEVNIGQIRITIIKYHSLQYLAPFSLSAEMSLSQKRWILSPLFQSPAFIHFSQWLYIGRLLVQLVRLREITKTGMLQPGALSCINPQIFSFPFVFSTRTWGYTYSLSDFVTNTAWVIPASWNTCNCASCCNAVTHVIVTILSPTFQLVHANSAWIIKNTVQRLC